MRTNFLTAVRFLALAIIGIPDEAAANLNAVPTIRVEYVQVPLDDSVDVSARAFAEQLRAEALKGTPFAALASRHKSYRGQQIRRGIEDFPISVLLPSIRTGLDSIGVGQISEVLVNETGLNIFKILRRDLASTDESRVLREYSGVIQTPTAELKPRHSLKGELSPSDLIWEETRAESTSVYGHQERMYFDLYRVAIAEPSGYEITVKPVPSCWNGTVIVPLVRILDSSGSVLLSGTSPLAWSRSPSCRIRGKFASAGDYYVFVGADNSPSALVAGTVVCGTHYFLAHGSEEGKYSIEIKLTGP